MRATTIIIVLIALFAFLPACSESTSNDTAKKELRQTEDNQSRLSAATPPPQFKVSQERKNLVRRLERWNVEDKISYIYLMTDYGQIVYYSTVKGKVSSLNSMLTCTMQPLWSRPTGLTDRQVIAAPSPDFDGSYGPNPGGIFFFNQDGVYVEWNGKYLLTDQPLKISVEPLLVEPSDNK